MRKHPNVSKHPNKEVGSWKRQTSSPMFAPCTIHVDAKKGIFNYATNSEIFKCCVKRCHPKLEFCSKLL